jgi:hypothetical protein
VRGRVSPGNEQRGAAVGISTANIVRTVLLAVPLVGLSGCESVDPTYELSSGDNVKTFTETRLFTPATDSGCLFVRKSNEKVGFVAAVLLPSLISAGVSSVQKAVSDAANSATATLTAQANFLPRSKTMPECIDIVSGRFEVLNSNDNRFRTTPPRPSWFDSYSYSQLGDVWTPFFDMQKNQHVALTEEPDLIIEIALVSGLAPAFAPEKNEATGTYQAGVRLVPTFISFNRPAPDNRSILRPNQVNDIKVTLGFLSIGVDKQASQVSIPFDKIAAGQKILFNADAFLKCQKSSESTTTGTLKCPGEAIFLKESVWTSFPFEANKPISLAVAVTETRQPSATLAFVAQVFGNAKTGTTNAIDSLLPGGTVATDTTHLAAATTLASKLATTVKDLQTCVAATSSAVPTALSAAQADEVAANSAAFAINGKPSDQPFAALAAKQSDCTRDLGVAQTYMATTLAKLSATD